jgi:hypothetical protein
MPRRSGSADLPLHGGHVPKWLADRMTRLGAVISQAIVHHYGRGSTHRGSRRDDRRLSVCIKPVVHRAAATS